MELISSSQRILEPTVATIGFFDGLHRGHQFLLSTMCAEAHASHLRTLVVTFSNSPRSFLNNESEALLSSPTEKFLLMSTYSEVDYLLILPFDNTLSSLSSEQFLTTLKSHYSVSQLYVGFNNSFGGDTSHGFSHYAEVGARLGIEVKQSPSFLLSGISTLSSTAIRSALRQGNMESATLMLGHPYLMRGKVVSGNQIGRQIGFPTANIEVPSSKILPLDGVYAGEVVYNGSTYRCVVNIGSRPTVGGSNRTIEVHLISFNGNLYNQTLDLFLTRRLRDEQTFSSLSDLQRQIAKDVDMVK